MEALDARSQDWLMSICVYKRQMMAECQVGGGGVKGGEEGRMMAECQVGADDGCPG